MTRSSVEKHPATLTSQAGLKQTPSPDGMDEGAWIEVIQQMDRFYADLVHSQVELENKNAALEDAQRFIQSVIASMSDILVVCDTQGRIQQVNSALESITGKKADSLLDQPLSILFSSEYNQQIESISHNIHSDALMDCEMDLIDASGKPSPMAINCSARFDHENRFSGIVMTGRPLGELRRAYHELNSAHEELKLAQQQLIRSEKMASLGRLIAGVAHELNNPISFIVGNMYALQRYEDRFQQYIDAIHNNQPAEVCDRLRNDLKIDRMMTDIRPLIEGSIEGATRVSEIVQDLQRFSTPQDQQMQRFDLVKIIQTAVHWVLKASRYRPDIRFVLPDEYPISNNEGAVHQILVNLIQNAVDAMEGQTSTMLELTLIDEGADAKICVHDSGPGIPDDILASIFDPFFTTKPVGKGTGLGLYVSHELASEQCHGSLTTDKHEHGGAMFILKLPRESGQ